MGDPHRGHRSSGLLLAGSVVAFCSCLLLIISFSSPYWLESYERTNSEFKRMGLWDVCFKNYRHPSYQYDEKFDGCYWIFSYKYQKIRDLLPGWLMFVQAMMTVALILALLSLICVSVVLMHFLLKFEVLFLACAFVLESGTALPIFLAICVFGGNCFDRSWLQYPNFNHLSWAYALAVVSFFFHGIAAGIFLTETSRARERRSRASNLVYNMQPRF